MSRYIAIIGLEVHAQLKTKAKMFAPEAVTYAHVPNSAVSPVSLGHPGTLPTVNKRCVALAIKVGLALHCKIARRCYFARKNYFYPDLPKGYQISQYATPIAYDGYLTITLPDGKEKQIGIQRIQLEEDTGKSLHDQDLYDSLIDLNRAGVGLIEIVSKADIRTPQEAMAYLAEIRKLVRYLDVCDGNMEEGSLRCDANVSVMLEGSDQWGTKVEIKNMNSISSVGKALQYEIERQIAALEKGEPILQETRMWDPAQGKTIVMRRKEGAEDYRYFPEPDLYPLLITDEFLESVKKELPELPYQRLKRYTQAYQLPLKQAMQIAEERPFADYFERLVQITHLPKDCANWMTVTVQGYLNAKAMDITAFPLSEEKLAKIILMVKERKINITTAKEKLFPLMVEHPELEPMEVAKKHNLLLEHDDAQVESLVRSLITQYPDKVVAYRNGKKGLLGFFVGQVMRATKGKADPKAVNQVVKQYLENAKV